MEKKPNKVMRLKEPSLIMSKHLKIEMTCAINKVIDTFYI